jgi:hypothetical protein
MTEVSMPSNTQKQIERLLYCSEDATPYCARNRQAFANIHAGIKGHHTAAVRSAEFRFWLHRYHATYHEYPTDPAVRRVMTLLCAKARASSWPFPDPERRVAWRDDPETLALGLLDADANVVEITSSAWRVIENTEFSFRGSRAIFPYLNPSTLVLRLPLPRSRGCAPS